MGIKQEAKSLKRLKLKVSVGLRLAVGVSTLCSNWQDERDARTVGKVAQGLGNFR